MNTHPHPTALDATENPDPVQSSRDPSPTLSRFAELPVNEVLHLGVVDCLPEASLLETAALMAEHDVHCVVVDGLARGPHDREQLVWGIVTDTDLMRALAAQESGTRAGEIATTEPATVDAGDDLQKATQIMAEQDCSHLIVTSAGRPVGVISALDIARALVWGRRPASHRPIV
jgi:CBS domain-containing protein